jgi:hypothetical protein
MSVPNLCTGSWIFRRGLRFDIAGPCWANVARLVLKCHLISNTPLICLIRKIQLCTSGVRQLRLALNARCECRPESLRARRLSARSSKPDKKRRHLRRELIYIC